jgi:4,5-dihydroxyphthalate decarboxylase
VDHPDVKPLIANAQEAGLAALKSRGHYPINHTIVIKDELLNTYPDLARDTFNAFAEAKRVYLDRLKSGKIDQPTAVDKLHQRVMDIVGDPLPYGLSPNRRVLDELIQTAVVQGILPRAMNVEDLFAPSTRGLVG